MDESYDTVRTVTDGRYRYIRNYMPHRAAGMHEAYAWNLKSYQDWERQLLAGKLTPAQAAFFQPKLYEQLFDLHADPDQVVNSAADPAMAGHLRRLRQALDRHMLAINDNGFIPEGSPLRRIMALAETAAKGDSRNLPRLRGSLADPNEVVRCWAAIGLLILGPAAAPAAAQLAGMASSDPSPQVRVPAARPWCGSGASTRVRRCWRSSRPSCRRSRCG